MWPNPDETHVLLRRAQEEGEPAAARLWERHREPLKRLISHRLDPALAQRVDASDVVQEVLIKANHRLDAYLKNPSIPFSLWLRRIALDQIIDEHRRHRVAAKRSLRRERSLSQPAYADRSSLDLAAQLRDSGLTPAASALRGELQRRFRETLARLDESDREVLVLRYFDRLSNRDVAHHLGLSEAAAGMRHLRALKRLRVLLEERPSQLGEI